MVVNDAAILAGADIASLTVTHGVTGQSGTSGNAVTISAVGQLVPGKTHDLAFGKINIGGGVSYANFDAGYDQTGAPVNGVASIGTVVVGGTWQGSNLIAGVMPDSTAGHAPWDAGATVIPVIPQGVSASLIPSIASIVIKGKVESASVPGAADTYGFVSDTIAHFSVDGVKQTFLSGQIDPVGDSVDAVARELS